MTVSDPSPETAAPSNPDAGSASTTTSTDAIANSSTASDAPAASSTATETGAGDPPKGAGDGAGDAPKPKSVFEAAKAALNPDKGADPSSADAKSGTQPPKPEDGKGGESVKPEDAKAEGDADIPKEFSKHPAWIRIAKDRDEAKTDAGKWRNFAELVQSSGFSETDPIGAWLNSGARLNGLGVTAQEKGILVEFAAATKTDPGRALAIITPIYEALRGIVGEGPLSVELKAQVDAGEITEDAARRIMKSEADSKIAGHRAKRAEEKSAADRATQDDNRNQGQMANAVYAWEDRVAKTEADWQRIAPLVNEQVAVLRQARSPRTPEEAVKCCDDALAMVKKTGGAFATPKPAVIPPKTEPSTRQQQTRAKDVFEHVRRSFA